MKQVSFWSSRHVAAARLLIILIYILLNILGLYTGFLLGDTGVLLQPLFLNSILIAVIILFVGYRKHASFYKRKLFEAAMGVCTFCIICFYGNQLHNTNIYLPFSNTTQAVSIIEKQSGSVETVKIKTNKETRQAKKEFRKQLKKAFANDNGMKGWVKILLIVLSVLVAAILLYFLAYIVCSLSCSGAEAAAWIVGILGLAGIVTGLFFLIRGIIGRKKKPKKDAGTV